MKTGQQIGALCGHLMIVCGALLGLWAIVRFFWFGNAPDVAVGTVIFFIWCVALQIIGQVLVWFSGTE